MTSRDALEKEANDHAMEHTLRTLHYKASKRDDFVAGYLQAANARDKEIEEKDERISNLSHSCVAAIERAIGAERELAALRARVKELIDAANILLGNDEYDTYWPQYQARVREAIKAFEIPLPEGKSTNNKEHNV